MVGYIHTNDDTAHKTNIVDADLHFSIDKVTRVISNNSEKISIMQYDHNSERFSFEIDRIVEGHDMLNCRGDRGSITIHSCNASSSSRNVSSNDIYVVTDVAIRTEDLNKEPSKQKLFFTWLISQNATKYAGTLNFAIIFACDDGNKTIYRWGTNPYKGITILPEIYNESAVTNTYPEVLLQWERQILAYMESSTVELQNRINDLVIDPADFATTEEVEAIFSDEVDKYEPGEYHVYSQIDSYLNPESDNPVKNKVVKEALDKKVDLDDLNKEVFTDEACDVEMLDRQSEDLTVDFVYGKYINRFGEEMELPEHTENIAYGIAPVVEGEEYIVTGLYGDPNVYPYTGVTFKDANQKVVYNLNDSTPPYNYYEILENVVDNNTGFRKITAKVIAPKKAVIAYYTVYASNAEYKLCNFKHVYTTKKSLNWLKLHSDNFDAETINQNIFKKDLNEVISSNLLTEFVDDAYINKDGRVTQNTTLKISYATAIGLIENHKLYVTLYANPNENAGEYLSFKDASDKHITYTGEFEETDIDNVYMVTVPKGAVSCRFNVLIKQQPNAICKMVYTAEDKINYSWLSIKKDNLSTELNDKIFATKLKYGNSIEPKLQFEGKKIAFFGDSITQGVASHADGTLSAATKNYTISFVEMSKASSSNNLGVSGTFICDSETENSIYNKVINYSGEHDIIVIAGGTNDYNFGKPLGVFGDTEPTTFYGALKSMCEHLVVNHSDKTVIFITPINQSRTPTTVDCLFDNNNPYRNAIFEVASSYGFNVVDGSQLGFPTDFNSTYKTYMIADGVHPTDEGYKMYARNLYRILMR